jgi:hypothetical protein
MVKSRRKRREGHVARMGRKGNTEGKRPLGKPRRRWVDNTKKDLGDTGFVVINCIGLAQDREKRRYLVDGVMSLLVP